VHARPLFISSRLHRLISGDWLSYREITYWEWKKRSEATETLRCIKADPQINTQTERGDYNTLRSLARSMKSLRSIRGVNRTIGVFEPSCCCVGENRGVQSTNAGFAVVREGHRPVINCRPVYLMPYNNLIYADFSDNAKVDIIGCRGEIVRLHILLCPFLIGEGIKRRAVWRLSVCRVHTTCMGLNREQWLGRLKLAQR